MSHYMYHKPSLLVGATVLFCIFAVPLSFSPEPNTFWSTYIPHQTLVQGQTELPAAPLSWASMFRLRNLSICLFVLIQTYRTKSPMFLGVFFAFSHVHMTLLQRLSWQQLDHDSCFLHGVLWRFWSGSMDPPPAAQGVSCDLLSLYHQCHWFRSSLTFAPKTITIITVDVRSFFFVTVTHKVSKPSPFLLL